MLVRSRPFSIDEADLPTGTYPLVLTTANPGGESGTGNWTKVSGPGTLDVSGFNSWQRSGGFFFYTIGGTIGGDTTDYKQDSEITDVNVIADIDNGIVKASVSAWHRTNDSDQSESLLVALAADGTTVLGSATTGTTSLTTGWIQKTATINPLPAGTRYLRRIMRMIYGGAGSGGNTDGFHDDWSDITLTPIQS